MIKKIKQKAALLMSVLFLTSEILSPVNTVIYASEPTDEYTEEFTDEYTDEYIDEYTDEYPTDEFPTDEYFEEEPQREEAVSYLLPGPEINQIFKTLVTDVVSDNSVSVNDVETINIVSMNAITTEDLGGISIASSGAECKAYIRDHYEFGVHTASISIATDATSLKFNTDSSEILSGFTGMNQANLFTSDWAVADTSECTNMNSLFSGDAGMEIIDLSNVVTNGDCSFDDIIDGCESIIWFRTPSCKGSEVTVTLPHEMCEDSDEDTGDKRTENMQMTSHAVISSTPNAYMDTIKITFDVEGNTDAFKPQYIVPCYGTVSSNVTGTAPEKAGYVLTGKWYTDSSFTESTLVSDNISFMEDTTLYGKYAVDEYYIHYNANSSEATGSMENSTHHYSVSRNLTPVGFTREFYRFAGWSTEPDGSGTAYSDKERIMLEIDDIADATVELYAQWEIISYTVQFNGNGATSGETQPFSLDYNEEKELPVNNFYRLGYNFTNWSDSVSGGNVYNEGQGVKNLTVSHNDIIIFYAQWDAKPYTLHFDGNGAKEGSMSDISMVYDKEITLPKNKFSRNGYDFVGWTTVSGDSVSENDIEYIDEESVINLTTVKDMVITFRAVWEPANMHYTVNHYYMDASGKYPELPDNTVEDEGILGEEVTVPYDNFNTDEYFEPAVKTLVLSEDNEASASYYYPRKRYTLTVVKGDNTKEVTGGGNYYWGETVTVDATPADPSTIFTYSFHNWIGYVGSNEKRLSFTMPTDDVSMTATCKEDDLYEYETHTDNTGKYKIYKGTNTSSIKSSDSIGLLTTSAIVSLASNAVTSLAAVTDVETNGYSDYITSMRKWGQNISQFPTITKEGYTLKGWYTSESGGTEVKKNTAFPKNDAKYYAQWTPNTYKISFQNGSKEVNKTGSLPATLTNVKYDSPTDIGIAVCNAKAWRGTIKFDPNGGTGGGTKTAYSTKLTWTTGKNGTGWGNSSEKNNSLLYNKNGMSFGGNSNGTGTIKKFSGDTIENTITNMIQGYEYQNNNGGTMNLFAQYDGCSDITAPAAPTKDFSTFKGWYTAKTGGTKKADAGGTLSNQTGNKTYYAQYDAYKWKIRFNSSWATGTMTDQTVTYGEQNKLNANQFRKTGYKLAGWSKTPTQRQIKFVMSSSSSSRFMMSSYSSSRLLSELEERVKNDSNLYNAVADTPNGTNVYSYLRGRNSTLAYQFRNYVNSCCRLYGGSSRYAYSSYNLLNSITVKTTYTYGSVYTKDGIKWTDQAVTKNTITGISQTNGEIVTLYAVWEPITYYVEFYPNGGTGSMTKQAFKYDTAQNLSNCGFSNGSRPFRNWSRNANDSGDHFSNGQSVINLTATDGAVVKLYSQWKVLTTRTGPFNFLGHWADNRERSASCNLNSSVRVAGTGNHYWSEVYISAWQSGDTINFNLTGGAKGYGFDWMRVTDNSDGASWTFSSKSGSTNAKVWR